MSRKQVEGWVINLAMDYLLALHSMIGLSNKRLLKLMDYFGDGETAWQNYDCWKDALQISKEAMSSLLSEKSVISLNEVYEKYLLSEAKVVTIEDDEYPQSLKNIANPPYLLYYKGELPKENDICIALIGSRRATSYGKEVAEFLGKELGEAGAWVISGLARGIDSCGHKGAIRGQGKTVGVLGCGIDVIYPKENANLFALVEENGCIISEFPLGMEPLAGNFPVRNRIISGLANGVVVVEAARKSGTQITVDYALEQGKDIFAVPGPIFSTLSQGTHKMIRDDGIKLVTSAKDILEGFGQMAFDFDLTNVGVFKNLKGKSNLDINMVSDQKDAAEIAIILDYLITPKHFNQMIKELKFSPARLSSLLTICEMNDIVCRLEGQTYVKKNL